MNCLQLVNRAKQLITDLELQSRTTQVEVNSLSFAVSKKHEVKLVLRQFDTEEELAAFGVQTFKYWKVFKYVTSTAIMYKVVREEPEITFQVSMICLTKRTDAHGYFETRFSAQS